MQKPSSFALGLFGTALISALACGCGLATEGGDFYEVIEDSDASIEEDAGEKDAGGKGDGGPKDAGADADAATDASADGDADTDAEPEEDAGPDGSDELDAGPDGDETDAEPEEDAGPDGSDDLDSGPGADADAGEPPPDAGDPDGDPGPVCCPGDPDVFPGQTAFFTKPNKCGNYDYDCDGIEEKEFGIGKACSRPTFGSSCTALTPGFKSKVPECGEPGIKFVGCTARTLFGGCDSEEEAVLQGCR